jgi:hypothetical protein
MPDTKSGARGKTLFATAALSLLIQPHLCDAKRVYLAAKML